MERVQDRETRGVLHTVSAVGLMSPKQPRILDRSVGRSKVQWVVGGSKEVAENFRWRRSC